MQTDIVSRIAKLTEGMAWDAEAVRRVHRLRIGALRASLPRLASSEAPTFDSEAVRDYFGLRPGHFLGRAAPDWGIALTEPQATRGLAHCVMARNRTARLRALLAGLGISTDTEDLRDGFAVAEKARVDLLVVWQGGRRITVVEAKLGHRVTPKQLATYAAHVRKAYPRAARLGQIDWILLTLDPDEDVAFRGHQSGVWRFVSWAEMMLGMERVLHEDADDADFRLFRRLLWVRVGGLRQEKW